MFIRGCLCSYLSYILVPGRAAFLTSMYEVVQSRRVLVTTPGYELETPDNDSTPPHPESPCTLTTLP